MPNHTIETVGNMLSSVEQTVNDIQTKVNHINTTDLQTKLTGVRSKLAAVISGIDSLQGGDHLGGVRSKMADIRQAIDGILDRLNAAVEVKGDLSDIGTTLGHVKERVNDTDVSVEVAALKESVANLTKLVWYVAGGLGALTSIVGLMVGLS